MFFLDIDPGSVDWARAQFALTAIFHWLFVPLTLGLGLIMSIMETIYYKTGKEFWKTVSRFWQRLFGINFAMGVATGLILEFEFGTNWSNYSWFVGDIFGAPLAIEGIVAFFLESTFVAVMYFGWKKVSKGFHLASTWLTTLGATISAWWILVANSWMQYPVGCEFNPDTMRNEMVSFSDVAFSPFAIDKFCHTVLSAWVIGAVFVVGVSAWYLLQKRDSEREMAFKSMKIGTIVGLVATILTAVSGDESAVKIGEVQPMKLAAMEALYNGGESQGLSVVSAVNPFKQPDYENEEEASGIKIPYGLSLLATRSTDGYVPGVNDILNGYTKPDGTVEPSADEKMDRGKKAISALSAYREAKKNGDEQTAAVQKKILKENFKYFGYGHIQDKSELVPYIPLTYWSFRIMVGLGSFFILYFMVMLYLYWKKKDIANKKLLLKIGVWMIPLAYLCSECGWLVAEFGRQPWTIQDMLPVNVSISDIGSGGVATTFFVLLALFITMLVVELSIMLKQIKHGLAPDKA